MELDKINGKLKDTMPSKFNDTVTKETLSKLELLINQDSELQDNLFTNLVDFKVILLEGKINVTTYTNAVLFTSYYLLGYSKTISYTRVFPERVQRFGEEGKSYTSISRFIDAYYKSTLIQKMFAQVQMPSHIMFRNVFYRAIKTQVELMEDDKVSATVRQKAACSLMGHLKEPEVQQIEIDVKSTKENDIIKDLMATTKGLAEQQKKMIQEGNATALDVAHSKIVEGTFVEKEDE